jgi:pyruvate/2-oxoglutarate dehydrogenase complex dihydrolipoamide acyltransferase (E2) component
MVKNGASDGAGTSEDANASDSWRPFSSVERAMANKMTRAASIPIATEWMEVDVADAFELEATSRRLGLEATFTGLVLAAVARGLTDFPLLAAEVDYDQKRLRIPDATDIGIAVASDRGLIVPIVRDVVGKPFEVLLSEMRLAIARARSGDRDPALFAGGHFTITNIATGGVHGGSPMPIVPQIAILGVGGARRVPVVRGDVVCISLVVQMTVALDHRILDGITVARFLAAVGNALEHPDTLIASNA